MGFHGKWSRLNALRVSDRAQCWLGGAVCGLGILLLSATRPAQAIDCQKAVTSVEHAICDDAEIYSLDKKLTQALHRALESRPRERDMILTDERRWIAKRDAGCLPVGDGGSKMHQCLEEAYQSQLDVVRRMELAAPADSRAAACKDLLDRYRPLAGAHPGQFPLKVLMTAGVPGFELAEHGESILNPTSDLVTWAKGQLPPISISPQLSESLASDESGGTLVKAPGVPFFMLARLEGSAGCDSSVFFLVKDGVALLSKSPLDDAEGDCPNGGVFASLHATPLFVRENYDFRPGMQASLEVATWHADHFEAACTVTLSYLPRVTAETLNGSDDSCSGADCEDLRKLALEFVKKKVSGTLLAEPLLQGLTAQQRDRYEAERSAAEGEDDPSASENVVFVPYLRQGDVYVIRIADRTVGWRDYADQSVKFERLEDGKIVAAADFSVGVSKGELESAEVLANP